MQFIELFNSRTSNIFLAENDPVPDFFAALRIHLRLLITMLKFFNNSPAILCAD